MPHIILSTSHVLVAMTVVATGYCACAECTHPYVDGITALGTEVGEGRTIAASPLLDLGTEVYVTGLGHRIVEDRGGLIVGTKIDVYFGSHQEALRFGVQELIMLVKVRR